MCTSICLKTKDSYFGRNMDLNYKFNEQIVITPRNFPFQFKKTKPINKHYALIGMATIIENTPLYAEATNEKGLSIAGLNFEGFAHFSKEINNSKINITPSELIPWILCQCKNTKEVKLLLKNTHIIDIPLNDNIPQANLHWHIADKTSSIVLECTKEGTQIYDNPVNVLTNNPPFNFQKTNLALYLNLETKNTQNCFTKHADIKAFCKGVGSFGLPGDFSSTSRFVKASYLILNSHSKTDELSSISQFFHILNSIEVVNGSITLEDNSEYFTTYSCCINIDKCIYYYKTYNNNRLTSINMYHENLDSTNLINFPIQDKQQILYIN